MSGPKKTGIAGGDETLICQCVTHTFGETAAATLQDGGKNIVLAEAAHAEAARAEIAKKAIEAAWEAATEKVSQELYEGAAAAAVKAFVKEFPYGYDEEWELTLTPIIKKRR